MKSILSTFLMCSALITGTILQAQSPLASIKNKFLNSQEIVIVSSFYNEEENQIQFQQAIYDHTGETIELAASEIIYSDYALSSRQVCTATGDFNGDGKDDYVFAYAAENGTIKVYIPNIDPVSLQISPGLTYTLPGPITQQADKSVGLIKLKTGDFDRDFDDEIIVAYVVKTNNTTGIIHLDLFDTKGSMSPQLAYSISDVSTLTQFNGEEAEVFDIAVDDLGVDGDADLLLAWGHNDDGDNRYNISARVIDITFDGAYQHHNLVESDLGFDYASSKMMQVAIALGNIYHTAFPSLIAATYINDPTVLDETRIRTFAIEDDSTTAVFNFAEQMIFKDEASLDLFHPYDPVNDPFPGISIATGDLTDDLIEEIVLLKGSAIHLFRAIENTTQIEYLFHHNFTEVGDYPQNSNHILAIDDLNRDKDPEVIVFLNDYWWPEFPTVYVFEIPESLTGVENGYSVAFPNQPPSTTAGHFKYSLATGDLDGDRVRLGKPQYFQITDIIQPLVILNSPPIHFDKINGVIHDISKCFNGNDCGHYSVYKWISGQNFAASTTVFSDWAVSHSISYGGGFFGLGIEKTIEDTHGGQYARTRSSNSTFEIRNEVVAKGDDYLHATVIDYDVWEFPVYSGDTLAGHVVDLHPGSIGTRWFPSKSWSGFRYIPNHEVGNILSYQDYTTAYDNPFVLGTSVIKENFAAGSTYVLDANSENTWVLTTTDFSNSSVARSRYIGTNIGKSAGFSLFGDAWHIGIGENTSENYTDGTINTHEVSIEDELEIEVNLGSLDMGVGEVRYNVGPYAYWSINGELNLNFVARPEIGVGIDTWWTANYGQEQDPAFILPWRLDEEKGYTLQDPLKKYQTKSIQFSSWYPEIGDTVTIYAIIHNFSLLPTEGPVKVAFYDGHPNFGGNILTDIYGNTSVQTDLIGPRKEKVVQFKWIYPEGLGALPKIFAYIDPDNEMPEIHEDNNIAITKWFGLNE